ncbi:maleylpyruvate isomerase N-terminal domain-containing protein [Terrimonas sp. NA20]|uniref:Maleylpyruvate isomerase N-terminal domain-containing protein n=1 Tax=Terrimonas ginsenosidimutans TaxID=2908004 RepID=A0ABS9KTV6_9BACT|nr:maleylpyruvate isomerase N-terminal domain-containing protein [Terrimonas ginsenosidimutans]MCG2615730.1 maleylpyruvate isomerase N-terminal domain-containing protein [Terrimonas ginsenosidimutans]
MVETMRTTVELFPKLDSFFIQVLKSLTEDDWKKRTLAKQWTVKDIALHLLDGNFRVISMYRDGFFGEAPPAINSYQDLINYLNELNGSWVKATRRMSTPLLIELLESSGKEYSKQMAALDPDADAVFSVSWAGEDVSKNWFHIAREYTEKFHHQMQIREAVSKTDALMTRELFYPFIQTMLMGLPHTYRNIDSTDGTCIEIEVSSSIGGLWFLSRKAGRWELTDTSPGLEAIAHVSFPPAVAWKLFTKGITAAEALKEVKITGNTEIGNVALNMISVMA